MQKYKQINRKMKHKKKVTIGSERQPEKWT